jgi:hypothetical protein
MEKQDQIICQSCGMPLCDAEVYGTNADGSKTPDYCLYCFKDGGFTSDVTMDEMIEHCLQYLDEFNGVGGTTFTPDEARREMRKFFPHLKRWQA